MRYLIVGLGNPGSMYRETRHNVGFAVVQALAAQRKWNFKADSELQGWVAEGVFENKSVVLFLPSVFMNRSGEALKACVDKWKVPLDRLIVVSDDVALPLGAMRLRSKGSSGGHNGLKNIERCLGTHYYARLRIGVGSPQGQVLSDYVLDPFLQEEKEWIKKSIEKALCVLDAWVLQGLAQAMQVANARKIKEEGEEKNG